MKDTRVKSVDFTVRQIEQAILQAKDGKCNYIVQEMPANEFVAMYGTEVEVLIRVIKKGQS